MSEQYPGGYITKSPVLPNGSTAPGMWTLSQQAAYQTAGLWPGIPDAQFNYVTMLLHGDGGNGGQNNTFIDSSVNALGITRYNNATQGSFSPYGPNWSNYFQGGGNYLSLASNAAFGVGTGDFTVECWIYPTSAWSAGGYNPIFYVAGTGLYFGQNASGFGLRQSGTADIIGYGTSPALNVWTHVAVVRSGTTVTMYYNGTSVASATSSANFSAGAVQMGYDGSYGIPASYISNFRLVKGTAVYTAAFTPSTTPLTAITNTSLLTCQSNRFIDNSSNAFAVTVNGTLSVQRFNPFGAAGAYNPATIGGSGYFDGTGDYLQTSPGDALNLSTGDYTIECWFYPTSLNGSYTSCVQWNPTVNNYLGTKTTSATWYDGSIELVGGTIRSNAWNHIAATRSGTSVKLFLNGAQVATGTSSAAVGNSTDSIYINTNSGGSYQSAGYYSDVRITKGGALYTGTFTPPTAPLTTTVSSGTVSLLTNMTNAAIYDNAMMNDLETVGNAQISTSVKKYGTGSLYFDGTGDYLSSPMSQNLVFGSGDVTFEYWIYANTISGIDTVFDTRFGGYGSEAISTQLTNGVPQFWSGSYSSSVPVIEGVSAISTSTWTHIAFTRASGTNRLFVNGVSVASNSNAWTQSFASGSQYYIGQTVGVDRPLDGYIDDLRITKGYARYTATFTPPTQAFPNSGPV